MDFLLSFGFVGRMVFGYAYPAYECYKAVEKNKPEIQQLRFWCQYWFVIPFLIGLCLEFFFCKVLSSFLKLLAGFLWLLWPFLKELGILSLHGWCYWYRNTFRWTEMCICLCCLCPVFIKGSAVQRGKAGVFHISLVP